MSSKLVGIVLFVSLFLSDLTASSKIVNTYFVTTSGSNKNSGQTPRNSFKTIQHALDLAYAGDTIVLLKGEFYEDVKSVRSGEKGKPIKIIGMEDAVLKGKKHIYIFQINHSYIELVNFTIDGKVGKGDKQNHYRDKLVYIKGQKGIGVTGVKLYGLRLQNALGECVRIKYFASKNEVAYNHIKNCGIRDFVFNRGQKNGEAIYIGTAPKQVKEGRNPTKDIDTSHQNWIHHNVITTRGNECVDIKEGSHHNILEHNICSKQLDPKSAGISIRGNSNTVRHNIIFDNKGAGIRLGGHKDSDSINNNIYDNYLSNNENGALKIMCDPNKNRICGNKIFVENKQKKVRTLSGQSILLRECKEER